LPLLDAMVPALSALSKTPANPPTRFGVVYVPNGMVLRDFLPKTEGTAFEVPRILKPLESFRDELTIVTGLGTAAADPLDASSGPHSRAAGSWLSGMRVKRTEGGDIEAGTTVDQFAAKTLGKQTSLASLELALEPNFVSGNCEGGYSCAYINTVCWRTATMPLPMETNPRLVFERLFGEGGNRRADLQMDRSILDSVSEDFNRLQRTLSRADRRMVSESLDAIRDVEQRIQLTEQHAENSPVPIGKPLGIPDRFEDHAALMFDLMLLAYQNDITRVITFQLGRELSLRSYPELGVPEAHHEISHHGNRADAIEKNARINEYHVSLFSRLVQKMRSTPDGDGSLLDHAMVLYGASMGDGNLHSPHNLPTVLVGRGSGQLKSGRYIKAKFDTPFMNLGLSLLDKLGVEVDHIGDSTGRLEDI
jgi:hypothetical protein